MRSSRVAIFHGPQFPFAYETVPIPALGPGEFLVRNEYTTLCRSDLNTFAGKRIEPTPTILGHEVVGRIVERGPAAPEKDLRGAELRVGSLLTWAIYAADPQSIHARLGLPQKSEGLFKYGHEPILPTSHLHGGLAEYCILRANTPVVCLDASVPFPVLALINCAVATVAGALRVSGGVCGRTVLVSGVGMLGCLACAMCRVAGAKRIVALDIQESRLAVARGFQADETILLSPADPPTSPSLEGRIGKDPAPIAFDFSGVPRTMETLIESLAVGGTLVLVGATFPQRGLQLNAERLVRRLLTLTGLHNYNAQDLLTAVEFIELHHQRFPIRELVHDQFTLDRVAEAFQYGLSSSAHRVGIRCEWRG